MTSGPIVAQRNGGGGGEEEQPGFGARARELNAAVAEGAGRLEAAGVLGEPLLDEIPGVGLLAGLTGGVNDVVEAWNDQEGDGGVDRVRRGAAMASGGAGAAGTALGLVEHVPEGALGWTGGLGVLSAGSKALSSGASALKAHQQVQTLGELERSVVEPRGDSAGARTARVMGGRAAERRTEALKSTGSAALETFGSLGVVPGGDKVAKLAEAGWLTWAARGIGSTLVPGWVASNKEAEKAGARGNGVRRVQNTLLPTQLVVEAFRNRLAGGGGDRILQFYRVAINAGESELAAGIRQLVSCWPDEIRETSRWSQQDKAAFGDRRKALKEALQGPG